MRLREARAGTAAEADAVAAEEASVEVAEAAEEAMAAAAAAVEAGMAEAEEDARTNLRYIYCVCVLFLLMFHYCKK